MLGVVVSSLGDGSEGGGEQRSKVDRSSGSQPAERDAPTVYVVENGDTLTAIAQRTGVSVAQIERLNPEVDPQVLVSGEELKLR